MVDGAWSPDSAQVAIVRDTACDANATTSSPDVMVFNGKTGDLARAFPLDAEILQATAPDSRAARSMRVEIVGVAWSPDGVQVAAPFIVVPSNASGPVAIGAALLTARGAHSGAVRLWTGTAHDFAPSGLLAQTRPHVIMVWDTQREAQRALTVAPAYAYRWGMDGALEPVAMSDAAPGAPSGPAGGAISSGGFSLWRRGQMWAVNALDCGGGAEKFLARPYIALQLSTLAWSPDGRYITQVSAAGRYDTPGSPSTATPTTPSPFTACSAGPAPDLLPVGPQHDAGLRAALALASAPGIVSVDLEWRPDGRRLAALTFNVSAIGSEIVIYDCRTGAVIHRYTAGQFPINGLPGTGPAKNFNQAFAGGAWSPDGRRLLVEAVGTGAIPFILGPGALGA